MIGLLWVSAIYGLFGFISVIWSMVNQILVLNFSVYGHFSYMVHFIRTKQWTIYPKPGVLYSK